MRIVTILLGFALLASGPLFGQSAPTLEVATNKEFYRADAENKVYLEISLGTTTGKIPSPPTASRNLTFVLDRSGSMAGASIQGLRRGMAAILNSLSDQDIVSIVLFGSEVETLVEAKPRNQLGDLDALLAQIEPAGGAALYDALNQGAAQLRRLAGPATINHLILVTDGPPTKGPREMNDFTKLAEAFVREGFTVSTIGLGEDFNEDMLATLARIGNGHFRYAAQPEKLAEALQAEIAPQRVIAASIYTERLRGSSQPEQSPGGAPAEISSQRTLVARDAVLTVQFGSDCNDIAAYGWKQGVVENDVVTYRFPYLFADQTQRLLTSAIVRSRPFSSYNMATVRLRWNDLADGKPCEITQTVPVQFERNESVIRSSDRPAVIRTSVDTLISEGMQRAIEQIDKGDFRRALRALRRTRDDARDMNYDLDDPQITARIRQLEVYLNEVQARGLNQLDRKILRSGLYNQFETPTEEPKDK